MKNTKNKPRNQVTFKSIIALQKQIDEQAKILKMLARWCAKLDNKNEHKDGFTLCVLPKPCDGDKFKDWDVHDYRKKAMEEVGEAWDAYGSYELEPTQGHRKAFLRECTDVIVAFTSLMDKAGADLNERQLLMNEVNHSNATRDNGQRFKKGA